MKRAFIADLDGVVRHFDASELAAANKLAGAEEVGMATHRFRGVESLRRALRQWGLSLA